MAAFKLPSGGVIGGSIRVIGGERIEAKLIKAEANILAHNRAMVTEMLGLIKAQVVPQIPRGPGHFGYHLQDTFTTDIRLTGGQSGTGVIGVLKSSVQGYWRELGTKSRFRGRDIRTGSERPFRTAHRALGSFRRVINQYYGGLANWWRT